MRLRHIARVTAAAAALALAAAGCSSGGTSDSADGVDKCKAKIGMFGALTGDAANLGKIIRNGIQLAVDEYNEENKDCKVTIVDYDSQGSPDQAPGLAQKAINDKDVLGIVGPAFSGESKAADPLFEEAGLVTISPSATNPKLADNGWKTFHRVLGNDATQGPAAAKYIKETMKAPKVFVVDDASEYGKGLADIVKQDLGSLVVGSDTVQAKQVDFAATVTKIKASTAPVFFYGGYYAEAGLLRKQLSDAGGQAITMVTADGVKDEGFVKAAGQAAAEGTIITCPCLPATKTAGNFAADYQKKFSVEAGTYAGEGFDSANILLAGIKDGKLTRKDMLDFVSSYEGDGVTKKIKFDDKGEVTDKVVWAYVVKAGKIVEQEEIK